MFQPQLLSLGKPADHGCSRTLSVGSDCGVSIHTECDLPVSTAGAREGWTRVTYSLRPEGDADDLRGTLDVRTLIDGALCQGLYRVVLDRQ